MTMHASMDSGLNSGANGSHESLAEDSTTPAEDTTNLGDEERGLSRTSQAVPLSIRSRTASSSTPPEEETELQTRPGSIASSTGKYIKHKTSQLLEAVTSSSSGSGNPITPKLAALVEAYAASHIATQIREEGEALRREVERSAEGPRANDSINELPDVALETSLLRGRKRASWGTQFRILSGRAFKNLYRDPALLTAHYLSSIALACEYFMAS